jgi:hypothetical protein
MNSSLDLCCSISSVFSLVIYDAISKNQFITGNEVFFRCFILLFSQHKRREEGTVVRLKGHLT